MENYLTWYIIAMVSITINLLVLTKGLYKKGFFFTYEYIVEEIAEPFEMLTLKKPSSID